MSAKKDITDLIKALEEQGFTVRRTKRGHYQVRDHDGQIIAVLSGTPSDWRSLKNGLARLRRAGFIWNR